MEKETFEIEIKDGQAFVHGHPELEEERAGGLAGDGMALFWGRGWRNYELFVANTQTGKIRKLATCGGRLLVDDSEIDYESIARMCEHGIENARCKNINYSGLGTWDKFSDGLCAISWMIYPDGEYFADSDGYGMQSNDEEVLYAVMDTNLDIIEPFRPIYDVKAYLSALRERRKNS